MPADLLRCFDMAIILLLGFFVEIALLVRLGQLIGGGLLFLELLVTAGLGYYMMRRAGRTMLRTNELIGIMANPAEYFRRSGWPLILAGLLLIVPGILSDIFGLVLFFRALLAQGATPPRTRPGQPSSTDEDVIDVEYQVRDEDDT